MNSLQHFEIFLLRMRKVGFLHIKRTIAKLCNSCFVGSFLLDPIPTIRLKAMRTRSICSRIGPERLNHFRSMIHLTIMTTAHLLARPSSVLLRHTYPLESRLVVATA